jgi:hypothetical protein
VGEGLGLAVGGDDDDRSAPIDRGKVGDGEWRRLGDTSREREGNELGGGDRDELAGE